MNTFFGEKLLDDNQRNPEHFGNDKIRVAMIASDLDLLYSNGPKKKYFHSDKITEHFGR